jgi:hypothetical protein
MLIYLAHTHEAMRQLTVTLTLPYLSQTNSCIDQATEFLPKYLRIFKEHWVALRWTWFS